MSKDIRIDDLARPVLSEAQQQALAWAEGVPVDLSPNAVLDAACQRTGLADFGADDFRARLALLCQEWDGDPDLSALSRLTLFGYLVRYASNRLLIHDTLNRHPEIDEEVIDRPVIVAGLPRSGTTHLVNLLAADRRFHSLPLWESYEPVPLPGEAPLPDGTDPRYRRCAEAWAGMQRTTPFIAAMHPMEPDHIHEELELMGPDFASYNFEWLAHSPRWRDHYYATDQTPHYQYMKRVLKLIQWRRRQAGDVRQRWVLKCPQHIEQLPVLDAVFPNATVVFTHRDPVAVIQSTVTMQGYTQRVNRKRIDLPVLLDYWVARVERLLRHCVRDRHLISAGRSHDSCFHDFMADQMGTMARVYDVAGLAMDSTATTRLADYIRRHPRGKEGRVIYNLEGNFGVAPEDLRERFRYYAERFPIRAEGGG